MEKMTPKPVPYTAAELVECGWVARVRQAIVNDGNAVGIGQHFTILAQTINKPEQWMPILLPNGGTRLTNAIECAMVLDMLVGKTPIPEPKPTNG